MPKTKGEQAVTRVSKGLLEKGRAFLKTQEARDLGIDSLSDLVNEALRGFLRRHGVLTD